MIYKHFKSKNQLYLELIILNEQRLLEISKKHHHDIKTYVSEYMLYNMLNSNRTILLHVIEERLTNNEKKLKDLFEELYRIREERIMQIKDLFGEQAISVKTLGGELIVKCNHSGDQDYTDIWLCGHAGFVFTGEISI